MEGKRACRKTIGSLDAFDCCMQAMWHFSQLEPEHHEQAIALAREAMRLDPDLAQANAILSRTLASRVLYGWSSDFERDISESYLAATRSVSIDDRDPYSHYAFCWVSLLRLQHSQALAEAQRSIDLNPNFALGFFALGSVRIYMGRFKEALDALLQNLRLNPNDPQVGAALYQVALAHYHQESYEEAVYYCERAIRSRRFYLGVRTLLASLGQVGRVGEAKLLLGEFNSLPVKDPQRQFEITTPYADPSYRQHLLEGLRRAGVTNLE
jgi:adenylate cyclase